MRRANKTGTVVKLPGKRRKKYAARVTVGKRITSSGRVAQDTKYLGYFETAKEAQQFLDRYCLDVPTNITSVSVNAAGKSAPTFKDVYDETIEYLNSRKKLLSNSTYRSLQAAYHNLSPLHHLKMKNIDYDMLQGAISKNSELSKSSMNNIRNLLKKMYDLALKKRYLSEDISKLCDYEYREGTDSIHSPFTRDEIQLLMNAPDDNDRDMILILIFTGMRIQELLVLETSNIFLNEQYFITGVKTDAGKDRIIPIHDKLVPIMKRHYDKDSFYFWDVGGSQRIYQTVRWRFDRYMNRVGMHHIPHDTRHSTATYLHEAGVGEMYIKLILGHHIDDLTQRVYIHSNPHILVQEINKLDL